MYEKVSLSPLKHFLLLPVTFLLSLAAANPQPSNLVPPSPVNANCRYFYSLFVQLFAITLSFQVHTWISFLSSIFKIIFCFFDLPCGHWIAVDRHSWYGHYIFEWRFSQILSPSEYLQILNVIQQDPLSIRKSILQCALPYYSSLLSAFSNLQTATERYQVCF